MRLASWFESTAAKFLVGFIRQRLCLYESGLLQMRFPQQLIGFSTLWVRPIFNATEDKALLTGTVVMITPVSFASIGYQTYIIFAVMYGFRKKVCCSRLIRGYSNAFIFPVVYFFYPETAYRSLEEMDSIFRKCGSIFTVVKIAKNEPRRYGKKGERLIRYEETDEHRQRQASVVSAKDPEKPRAEMVENTNLTNPD